MNEEGRPLYLLLAGGIIFTLIDGVLLGSSCPEILLAANSNPFLHRGRIMNGLYMHLALVFLLVVLPPLIMAPYRVYAMRRSLKHAVHLLGWETLSLYAPSTLAAGLVALIYRLHSKALVEEFYYLASSTALTFSALAIYASVLAVPWATAKALAPSTPSKTRLMLIGAASIAAAKLSALLASIPIRFTHSPVIWGCSAEALGIRVVNPKTRMLEQLYTVDASHMISTLTAILLYYYILVKLLGKQRP